MGKNHKHDNDFYAYVEEEHHSHQDHKDNHDDDCVCKIVRKIHKAQLAVEESDCRVSCERSIEQLFSPINTCPKVNTIPFSLDCGCETFFGKGSIRDKHGKFRLISSPFFKVKKINRNCCAVLELLWPTCDGKPLEADFKNEGKHDFNCIEFNGFIGTGACINVDLKCFCSISCHEAVWVDRVSKCQLHDICQCH